MSKASHENKEIVILGDFNCDFAPNVNCKQVNDLKFVFRFGTDLLLILSIKLHLIVETNLAKRITWGNMTQLQSHYSDQNPFKGDLITL